MTFVSLGPQPCLLEWNCRNAPMVVGDKRARCGSCRWSPAYTEEELGLRDLWSPIIKSVKLPEREAHLRQKARDKTRTRAKERLSKDHGRRRRMRSAVKAEERTERVLVESTRNSGRKDRDGDHRVAGRITLDTKHQSTRLHPVIQLDELAKVRRQAQQSGNILGALVLRNKNQAGVVAIDEGDFGRLLTLLEKE